MLKRKTEEAEAARKRIRELLELQQRNRVQRNESTVNVECQPNAGAPLLRSEPARRQWLEQELDLCNTSWEYQKVGVGQCCCLMPGSCVRERAAQWLSSAKGTVDTLRAVCAWLWGMVLHMGAHAVCMACCIPYCRC